MICISFLSLASIETFLLLPLKFLGHQSVNILSLAYQWWNFSSPFTQKENLQFNLHFHATQLFLNVRSPNILLTPDVPLPTSLKRIWQYPLTFGHDQNNPLFMSPPWCIFLAVFPDSYCMEFLTRATKIILEVFVRETFPFLSYIPPKKLNSTKQG